MRAAAGVESVRENQFRQPDSAAATLKRRGILPWPAHLKITANARICGELRA